MCEIHLCQPQGNKSCAACCGIYNYVDNSRDALEARLRRRTQLFGAVRAGSLTIDQYREAIRRREDQKRIYTTIYTCEFVGFVDEARRRVGCMLHPIPNGGLDQRDISFYGREICEGHFCPSYQKLTPDEARIVIDTIDDWYLYGCVITDIDFVKTFLKLVQDRLGETVNPLRLRRARAAQEILSTYFELKVNWPYRDKGRPRFGKYYFVGEDYDIDRIDYARLGADISAYDAIFLSLSSHFSTPAELASAEARLEGLIDGFCHAYHNPD